MPSSHSSPTRRARSATTEDLRMASRRWVSAARRCRPSRRWPRSSSGPADGSATSGPMCDCTRGKPVVVEDVGTPPGCRIEVLDLFSATPARRKFLKAATTEAGHVAQLVGRFALARPEIGFELRQDQRAPVTFPPAGRRERIRRVLGAEIEAEMRAVEFDGADPRRGIRHASPRRALAFAQHSVLRQRPSGPRPSAAARTDGGI